MVQIASMTANHVAMAANLDSRLGDHSPWTRAMFQEDLEVGSFCQVLLAPDDQVIGFAVTRPMPDACHLLNLGVDPLWQRQGWGGRLVDQAIAFAANQENGEITLEVRESNLTARGLYLAKGFYLAGRRKGYYRLATHGEDALILTRKIGG